MKEEEMWERASLNRGENNKKRMLHIVHTVIWGLVMALGRRVQTINVSFHLYKKQEKPRV